MGTADLTVGEFRVLLEGGQKDAAATLFVEIAPRLAKWACHEAGLQPDLAGDLEGEAIERILDPGSRALDPAHAEASLEGWLRRLLLHLARQRWHARLRHLRAMKRAARSEATVDSGDGERFFAARRLPKPMRALLTPEQDLALSLFFRGEDASSVGRALHVDRRTAEVLRRRAVTRLRKAVAGLPQDEHECLALRLEGRDRAEVAEMLGVTQAVVVATLGRALRRLRGMRRQGGGDSRRDLPEAAPGTLSAREALAHELWRAGAAYSVIAEALGVSRSATRSIIRRLRKRLLGDR